MLDVYYANEKPLPPETHWVCRLVRATTTDEQDAVKEILRQYFSKHPDGWRNGRADEEIRKAKKRIKSAKTNGKKGGRPITQRVSDANQLGSQSETQSKAHQKPNTKSQKRVERATRLPTDWQPSELLHAWSSKERPDLEMTSVIAKFRDYWTAKPGSAGTKLDWDATFRNWVREEKTGRAQKIQVDL
jgi:uncharacterized protein YdaU (DUF1376 family)